MALYFRRDMALLASFASSSTPVRSLGIAFFATPNSINTSTAAIRKFPSPQLGSSDLALGDSIAHRTRKSATILGFFH